MPPEPVETRTRTLPPRGWPTLIDMTVATLTSAVSTLPKGFRLLTGSTISSTLPKSCTCSSLSG